MSAARRAPNEKGNSGSERLWAPGALAAAGGKVKEKGFLRSLHGQEGCEEGELAG